MSTLTCRALSNLTALRNTESESPNFGIIIAAEIFYIAIIPFSVVEAAFTMIASLFKVYYTVFQSLVFYEVDEPFFTHLFREIKPSIILAGKSSINSIVPILWACTSALMNVLPVSLLKTEAQARQFFYCSEDVAEIPEIDRQRVVHLRPVRTNAMSGFLANR